MRFIDLICDLDGTLIDSLPGIEFSANEAVRQCLPDRQLPSLRSLIGPPVRQIFTDIWPDLTNKELNCLISAFRKHYDEKGCLKSEVYPAVVNTLRVLSRWGVNLYVVTNKPLQSTTTILQHVGLIDMFRDVSTPDKGERVWTVKAEGVNQLIEKHRLTIDSTMLVGDSWDDKKAAAECGLFFVPVAYGYGYAKLKELSSAGQENRVINSFEAILKFYNMER